MEELTAKEEAEIKAVPCPGEDPVNHPPHYTNHPSGIECIQITKFYCFCLGNAIKYIWRAGLKGDNALEDLKKASWYLNQKIEDIESGYINKLSG